MRDLHSLPQNWEDLELGDLVFAYRKAKVDCFYERSVSQRLEYAQFEQSLESNLVSLLHALQSDSSRNALFNDVGLFGAWHMVPKRLQGKQQPPPNPPDQVHFSDKRRAFEALYPNGVELDARLTSLFSVRMHVISSLWVNLVGQRLDAFLGECAYGNRVRRAPGDSDGKRYALHARGTFPPYIGPYRRWRESGILAMRGALEQRQRILTMTMDFSSYFHGIDPGFADSDAYYDALFRMNVGRQEESVQEVRGGFARDFTREIVGLLRRWQKNASTVVAAGPKQSECGIPIALSAARVLANVLLAEWDHVVLREISPIYYGRYVDDLMLVLRDSGDLSEGNINMDSVLGFLGRRLPDGMLRRDDHHSDTHTNSVHSANWSVNLAGYHDRSGCWLKLQPEKQRLFALAGAAGSDLIGVIEQDIQYLASERRMMPMPQFFRKGRTIGILAATVDPGEVPDSLKMSDGLSLRRLGWSIHLSHAETLQGDLPAVEWKDLRQEIYDFASSHVITPARVLDYWDNVPRLLALAVACRDWSAAQRLVMETREAVKEIRRKSDVNNGKCKLNGVEAIMNWTMLDQAFQHQAQESVIAAWPDSQEEPIGDEAENLLKQLGIIDVAAASSAVQHSDLGYRPWKECLFAVPNGRSASALDPVSAVAKVFEDVDLEIVERFLRVVRPGMGTGIPIPILFPTRPITPAEIAEIDSYCNDSDQINKGDNWWRLVRAICGYSHAEPGEGPEEGSMNARLGKGCLTVGVAQSEWKPNVCLSSFEVTEKSWSAAASGVPDLSLGRYAQLAQIVNQTLEAKPNRPDYLLLPELSLPIRWRHSIANKLLAARISLIAGLEYEHGKKNRVKNQAFLALLDDRYEFPMHVYIRQDKQEPAAKEERDLLNLHGKVLASNSKHRRQLYVHRGFCFGILLCSEVQDVKRRAWFRGKADALFVLSWNRDLEAFESLIESSALDVHAYIGMVNNREYGDSRLRAPAKERHMRDLCRVRGGLNDYIVIAAIDHRALRKSQSRAKRWPREGDLFKPVPDGFQIAHWRRVTP